MTLRKSAPQRAAANAEALRRLGAAAPVLLDVRPAGEVVPGFSRDTILTSGPTLPWPQYVGGQRAAVLGAALFEGLAANETEAERRIAEGAIKVRGCQELKCIGSLAGPYSASMPVFVVQNRAAAGDAGNFGYCSIYEGTNHRRLNYGAYDEGVRDRLRYVGDVIAPALGEAVRATGGIPLKPIMVSALHMSDDLHSRNTAASLLFCRALFPGLLAMAATRREAAEKVVQALTEDHYFFLRLSMAAAKSTADAITGIEGSSVMSAMAFNCRGFSIRVAGLGETWFNGPHATVEAVLFKGHSQDEITWMGGESPITETIGLGGFAQAAAFPLQKYQGGSPEGMVKRNLSLYNITVGENPDFRIPFLQYRGTPTGVDIFKVLDTGIRPLMNIGVAGRDGGQIGAGTVQAPIECFQLAAKAYRERYGDE
ncbi:MAG: DUF1116 domain-containing protein [Proteobacteria bacterium]|nr:DUF1116 domain-containing protein [Pseudomonadota bacterium]